MMALSETMSESRQSTQDARVGEEHALSQPNASLTSNSTALIRASDIGKSKRAMEMDHEETMRSPDSVSLCSYHSELKLIYIQSYKRRYHDGYKESEEYQHLHEKASVIKDSSTAYNC